MPTAWVMLLVLLLAAGPQPPADLTAAYKAPAARIVAAALAGDGAWKKLEQLCDRVGARQTGSAAMGQAITWASGALSADGHQGVHTEEVKVAVWERGDEEAQLVRPIARRLFLLGLGGTAPTPAGGLEAEVVVAPTFEALDALGDKVKGKIVLFAPRMEPTAPGQPPSYGKAVAFRTAGPSRAARLGAVAALVRSLATHSLRSPHTGAVSYDPKAPKIPAAALSTEDADLIQRLATAGEKVTVRLRLASRTRPEATEANVIGELRGREHPEQVVLVSAHLDSWDVGQGAHDDGAGVAMAMQALTVLRELHLTPRRTIRVVLFANEENGGRGAAAYAQRHKEEIPLHVAALETDSGGGAPLGAVLPKTPLGAEVMKTLATLLAAVGADRAHPGVPGGADVHLLGEAGVPIVGYEVDSSRYFDYHHSQADTLDKVDRDDLRKNVAALAVTAYILADMPATLR